MLRRIAPARAFTLIELLVVIAIISLLLSMLGVAAVSIWRGHRQKAADIQMNTLSVALEGYRNDFGDYPPDTTAGKPPVAVDGMAHGSEILVYYLYTPFRRGERVCGPYLKSCEASIRTGDNGLQAIYSPLGNKYVYANISGTRGQPRCVVIDPGQDRRLGGTIDALAGFVPNGTDANSDGVEDYKDNIKHDL